MTENRVDAVIAAFLEHLESGQTAPSVDHLTADERIEVNELIELIKDSQGVNFNRSRPSLGALLTGTEFESLLDATVAPPAPDIETVRTEVIASLGGPAAPVRDVAAEEEGIRSDAVIRYLSLRIRLQFRADIASATRLSQVDPRTAAGPVFGRFPDTAAVVLVIGDEQLSSVTVGPFDVVDFIGAPDGRIHRPRITRPVLGLHDTLRRLVDEFAPDLTGYDATDHHERIEFDAIIRDECAAACATVRDEGKKARTDAKKEAWAIFDESEYLGRLVADAASGELSDADLDARLTPADADAA